MSPGRRTVRITVSFFDDLDAQLPHERGPNGEPSANDFQVYELLRIVDRIAVEWESLAELIAGRPDYRALTAAGILVAGATERDVCIGDRWSWGTARLENSASRGPCYKLGIRLGDYAAGESLATVPVSGPAEPKGEPGEATALAGKEERGRI